MAGRRLRFKSGMAVSKRSIAAERAAIRARRAPKASKAFAKKVLAVVSKTEETKYVAQDIQKAVPIDTYIAINSDLVTPIPVLVEGTGSWQRVGQHIHNVRGKTHFQFSLPYNTAASANWVVRVYMLTSKQVKAFAQVTSLAANTLLDNGDGTTIDWDPSVNQVVTLSQRPLARENFSGTFKEFLLAKNSGSLNGDASTPPPSSNGAHYATQHRFTWKWQHKSKVMYDENSYLPTNYNPMFILVAYPRDGYSVVSKEASPVVATIRTEMYFKDN